MNRDHLIALGLEHPFGEPPHVRFVLDDEHRFRAGELRLARYLGVERLDHLGVGL